ncbi:MAG TPA: hypothetical protein VGE59_03815 [Patescibacteria group bacterium]
MYKKLSGSILIESMITAAIVVVLLLLVSVSFIQTSQMSINSSQKTIALGIIATTSEEDSQRDYEDTELSVGTKQFNSATKSTLSQLPEAIMTRTIVEKNGVKILQYLLEWKNNNHMLRTSAEYELTRKGIAND